MELFKDIPVEENETTECPFCHTMLKVTRKILIAGSVKVFTEDCPNCAVHEQERKKEERRRELAEKFREANIGKRYYNISFSKTEIVNDEFRTALKRAKTYCDKHEEVYRKGLGIYFYGPEGRGKTHIMSLIARSMVANGYSCRVANLLEMRSKVFSESGYVETLKNVDFLFLDDIGTEKQIKDDEITFIQEKLFEIVEYRLANYKPTLFTSNYSLEELCEKNMMVKTVDRIYSLATARIKIDSDKSYRLREDETIF